MLNEGDKAPNVTLDLPDGSKTSIADQAGKILVLYFYPKDDTPGCTTEAQGFTALADDFAKAGATIIGVSKDSAARHQKFKDKYGLKIELASDNDGAVCEAYGTWIEKSLYGRQYMGIDRATFLIAKDGTIAKIWRKVKVKGHAEAVLEAAKGL
jgi:thioredoxin-dependent peroxiredoxin